ncbi:hypothetical protein WB67_00500, partial [bacteria symbiont BFo2 of Frankliniella occidentalis]
SDVAGNTSALSSAVHINFDITPPNAPQLEWDGQNIIIKLDDDIKENDIIDLNIDGDDHKISISTSDIDNGYINYEWIFKEHLNTNEIYSYITDAAGNKSGVYDIEKNEEKITEFDFNESISQAFQKGSVYSFDDLSLKIESTTVSGAWPTGIYSYDGTMNLQLGNSSEILMSSKNNDKFNAFDFTLGNMNGALESLTLSFLDENGNEVYSKKLDINSGLNPKSDHVRIEMPELNTYFTTVKIHGDDALLWLNDIKLSSNKFIQKNKEISTSLKYDDIINHDEEIIFKDESISPYNNEENINHSQNTNSFHDDIQLNSISNLVF